MHNVYTLALEVRFEGLEVGAHEYIDLSNLALFVCWVDVVEKYFGLVGVCSVDHAISMLA